MKIVAPRVDGRGEPFACRLMNRSALLLLAMAARPSASMLLSSCVSSTRMPRRPSMAPLTRRATDSVTVFPRAPPAPSRRCLRRHDPDRSRSCRSSDGSHRRTLEERRTRCDGCVRCEGCVGAPGAAAVRRRGGAMRQTIRRRRREELDGQHGGSAARHGRSARYELNLGPRSI